MLVKIADTHHGNKKTYNNSISALRRAFDFGYLDYPEKRDPAAALKCSRRGRKDRPSIDPFSIQDAEILIAALHRDWGELQGNYDELRFFTGLRPSEEIALVVTDYDAAQGVLPIPNVKYPYWPWHSTLQRLALRYRKPYMARHTSVSWNLMIGRNPLLVAKEHGHRIATMLSVYAAWTEGAVEADITAIREAMNRTGSTARQAAGVNAGRGAAPGVDRPHSGATTPLPSGSIPAHSEGGSRRAGLRSTALRVRSVIPRSVGEKRAMHSPVNSPAAPRRRTPAT
jgi:hypothetical protein